MYSHNFGMTIESGEVTTTQQGIGKCESDKQIKHAPAQRKARHTTADLASLNM